MKLRDLLPPEASCAARYDALEIGGIVSDSRAVKPGFLFVAAVLRTGGRGRGA